MTGFQTLAVGYARECETWWIRASMKSSDSGGLWSFRGRLIGSLIDARLTRTCSRISESIDRLCFSGTTCNGSCSRASNKQKSRRSRRSIRNSPIARSRSFLWGVRPKCQGLVRVFGLMGVVCRVKCTAGEVGGVPGATSVLDAMVRT